MPEVRCKKCGKKFYVRKSLLAIGWGKYCSKSCHYQGMQQRKQLSCFTCNKEIFRNQSELRRSKSNKFFCSKSCQTKWRNRQYIGEKHLNWRHGRTAYKSILPRNKIAAICSLCGTADRRVLAVHHIDENHLNNELRNLAWVCHNCHHLVHNDKVEKQRFLSKIAKK